MPCYVPWLNIIWTLLPMCEDFFQAHVHSTTSFHDGLDPIGSLVEKAALLNQPAIGLTDHGVLYGAPMLFEACRKHSIRGVIGMEAYEAVPHTFDLERDSAIFKMKWADMPPGTFRYFHLTLWALNQKGWQNLCALHTQSFTSAYKPKNQPLIDRASLERHSEGLAVGLGCMASRTSQNLANHSDMRVAYDDAKWYAEVFEGRCFMEVMGNLPDQQALLRPQRQLAKKLGVPVMPTNDVHYRDQTDGVENGPHHILVQGRRWKKADTDDSGDSTDKSDAGFGQWYGSDEFYLKSMDEMLATGFDRSELANTIKLLGMVDFKFEDLPRPEPPIADVPEPGNDMLFDAWLAQNGENQHFSLI